jgi:hypothetical protein
MSAEAASTNAEYTIPSDLALQHAVKISIVKDKPVMLDYWLASLEKNVIIGVKEDKEKLLVKSEDEYTSPISKIFKVETEYLIETENSLYIVSSNIASKRIA